MRKSVRNFTKGGSLLILCLSFWGCTQTYPSHRVKESIQEICRKEYGIENIQVKIEGRTIGVYLPIKKLFATDLKGALSLQGLKAADMENLFQPDPAALLVVPLRQRAPEMARVWHLTCVPIIIPQATRAPLRAPRCRRCPRHGK